MEEDPEDLSSLHFQIMFPPHEPSNRQREYELEQHLALMDEPARTPVRKTIEDNMEDMGNLTIEHLTNYDDKDERQDNFVLMEGDRYAEEDLLDIGIQASDLGSLFQQFEQTEAAMTMSGSVGHRESSKSNCKSSKVPVADPMNLAKKITPVKRKTILLEPLAMPSKRLRTKDLLTTERACVSLPGSRASSPVTVQNQGMSVICSADQGFDYLVMDHDYCSVNVSNGQVTNQKKSASSIPLNVSSKSTVEERKAVYKQKYKIRKKGKKTGGRQDEKSEDQVNLINKIPDYIHPMPQVVLPAKSLSTGAKTKEESKETETIEPPVDKDIAEKPVFFDKIPDYFLGKHMYQEISKVAEEEAKKKEEMTRLMEKKEGSKCKDDKETKKEQYRHRHRSHHHGRDKLRSHRKAKSSISEKATLIGEDTVTIETLPESTASERKGGELNEKEIKPKVTCVPQNTDKQVEAHNPITVDDMSNGYSQQHFRRASNTESHSRLRSRTRSRSISSRSSHSRSSSGSSVRNRSCSSSSQSSHYSRSRLRRDSRVSYTSESSSSSRSRSRSRSHSNRQRSRRYSTYSSASRTSSSSRSRSRSHSRSRNWRPRSYSRSPLRSRKRSRERSRVRSRRSRSYYSGRSHSRDNDRRHRSSSRRRDRNSRSRSRRRSLERHEEERRKQQLKDQQEQWSDRRVIYIGRIPYGTTRHKIKKRFEKFGEIERITLHFREVGDNYAFVTFLYKCDAYAAVEGANKDSDEPEYDICFGGRRQFCKSNYEDLDSMTQEERALKFGYDQPPDRQRENKTETDFDRLLREAMKKSKR